MEKKIKKVLEKICLSGEVSTSLHPKEIICSDSDGGKKLSKSDLLFSTVVSNWEKGREEIEGLINIINKKGQGFDFNSDFVMRSCLYLICQSSDLKIENLSKKDIITISKKWDKMETSIIKAIDLIVTFGFCSENLIYKNAVIPLIYYIYKKGLMDENSKFELRKYLIVAQLKHLFGAGGNSTLLKIKKVIDEHKVSKEGFRLEYLKDIKLSSDRDFIVRDEDIENMLNYDKGTTYAFMVLSLLYPELKLDQIDWYQAYIHPNSNFRTNNLKQLGLSDEEIEDWQTKKNKIPNLQLWAGREKEREKYRDLSKWLAEPNYFKYSLNNISYSLDNFAQFFEMRKALLRNELKKILK